MSNVEEKRTGFLQVPNVFFETCDLPESAQTFFLRLATHLGKHRQIAVTGSIRQIATLVRMSKSTINRVIYVLIDAELITVTLSIGIESSHEVMSIEVNMDRLWDLNTYHTTVAPVPSWDKVLPDCPNLGHGDVKMGHDGPDWDTEAPFWDTVSHPHAQIWDNTSNTNKTNSILEEDSTTPSAAQPSSFSLEEETMLQWLKEKAIPRRAKDVTMVKEQLATLSEHFQTRELLHKYCDYAKEQYRERKNPVVALGNLASQTLLNGFLQAQETARAASPIRVVDADPGLATGDYAALLAEIQNDAPGLVLQQGQDEEGPYISLRWGPGQLDYVVVRDREEWDLTQGDQWVMSRARAYAGHGPPLRLVGA